MSDFEVNMAFLNNDLTKAFADTVRQKTGKTQSMYGLDIAEKIGDIVPLGVEDMGDLRIMSGKFTLSENTICEEFIVPIALGVDENIVWIWTDDTVPTQSTKIVKSIVIDCAHRDGLYLGSQYMLSTTNGTDTYAQLSGSSYIKFSIRKSGLIFDDSTSSYGGGLTYRWIAIGLNERSAYGRT